MRRGDRSGTESVSGAGSIALTRVIESLADLVAERVFARMKSGDSQDLVDQCQSPLGRRRHINAIRSGKLPGTRVGRRYLATRDDLEAFLARRGNELASEPRPDDVEALAVELGLTGRSKRD